MLLKNSELAFFDFTERNRTTIEVVSLNVSTVLFHASRPMDLLQEYTSAYSGRMRPLPDWACGKDGAVVGVQGGQERVLSVVKTLQGWGVKVAAVW